MEPSYLSNSQEIQALTLSIELHTSKGIRVYDILYNPNKSLRELVCTQILEPWTRKIFKYYPYLNGERIVWGRRVKGIKPTDIISLKKY